MTYGDKEFAPGLPRDIMISTMNGDNPREVCMSERKLKKPRRCNFCGEVLVVTARELIEHAGKCAKSVDPAPQRAEDEHEAQSA